MDIFMKVLTEVVIYADLKVKENVHEQGNLLVLQGLRDVYKGHMDIFEYIVVLLLLYMIRVI